MDPGEDQRQGQRVKGDYWLRFSQAGRDRGGVGRAVDLSESGLRFVTAQPMQAGTHFTLQLFPRRDSTPVLTRLATVIRCLRSDDGSGYALGCVYD